MTRSFPLGILFLIGVVPQSAAPRFEPIQQALFGTGGTLTNAFADYDRDGDLDFYIGFNGAANRLYRNDRGTFADVAAEVMTAPGARPR